MFSASNVWLHACIISVVLIGTDGFVDAAQRPLASTDAQRGVESNPYSSSEDVTAGKEHFASRCVGCHGPNGEGNRGPDLTRAVYRHGNSDRAIFMNILSGIPGTGMPSIRLSDKEMWQLVAYLRTLNRVEESLPVGDPAEGVDLFHRHDCGRCHFIDGTGGRLGPDLSSIGWSRSAAHLRKSLIDPNDDIEDDFRQVVVTTNAGNNIQGLLRNEDTYSILLLDTSGRLRSVLKSDLQKIERPEVSLMPSFSERLDERELDDMVSYLASLRRR